MTHSAPSLPRPAAAMREYAQAQSQLRSHRKCVDSWLQALSFDSVEELFSAVGGKHPQSTAVLLAAYQGGESLAATILIGAKAVMLSAVTRHAPGESLDERFQTTVAAFLAEGLARVRPNHPFVDAQLYWTTLRAVTRQHQTPAMTIQVAIDDIAGADIAVTLHSYLQVEVLLEWAITRGVLTEMDHRALLLRFTGDSVLPVREVAASLGVSENALESRLRRALPRLREAMIVDHVSLQQTCVDAHWTAAGTGQEISTVGTAA